MEIHVVYQILFSILHQLENARHSSVIDLATGFYHILMDLEDSHKRVISIPFGHYQFDRMPFGLKNWPASSCRLMDIVLSGWQVTDLFVYSDDIVIYAWVAQNKQIVHTFVH